MPPCWRTGRPCYVASRSLASSFLRPHQLPHGVTVYAPATFSRRESTRLTLLDDLQENAARVHGQAILVAPVHSAKLPAATAIVEPLEEAIPSTIPCVCNNRIAPALPLEEDRLQVTLPTVGRIHMSACDESIRGLQRAKAQRGAVRRIQRDLFAIGRHVECWNRRERVFRESRLSGEAAAYTS